MPIISGFFRQLADILHDPVLRAWRWRRLCRRVAPAIPLHAVRPGDGAVHGAARYGAALNKGDEDQAAHGLRQLLGAAEQAIAPSGINREGSSRRQRQLAALYLRSWLAARQAGRPEQWRLAAIARSLLAALQAITLPGGLPDIGAAPADQGPADPFAALSPEDCALAEELLRNARIFDLEALRADGWLRLDCGPWSGLWHCPPGGWPMAGGLGHQDIGAAELHWQGLPLFVDPGSPPEGVKALERLYGSSVAHGGISLQGCDPYPFDRPFYGEAFRRDIAGPPPILRSTADGVKLTMEGYLRQGGHRQIERHWRFQGAALRIEDLVLGTGQPLIERRLVTPWTVARVKGGLSLEQEGHRLLLTADQRIILHPARRWDETGRERPLTLILLSRRANLPWRGAIALQPAP